MLVISRDTYQHLHSSMLDMIRGAYPWRAVVTPNKHSHILEKRYNQTPLQYLNVMSCSLPGYWTYWKIINIHEQDCWAHQTSGFVKPGESVGRTTQLNLTPLRCAIYAAAMISYIRENGVSVNSVAIFGVGKLGSEIAYALDNLCSLEKIVLNRANFHIPCNLTQKVRNASLVDQNTIKSMIEQKEIDVCITCTSEWSKRNLFRVPAIARSNAIWISFDCGYFLDNQFLKDPVFADDPAQIEEHIKEEFPWNTDFVNFRHVHDSFGSKGDVLYVYGTAIADAVVMQVLLERDLL